MLEGAINSGFLPLEKVEHKPANATQRTPLIQECLQSFDLLGLACQDAKEDGEYGKNFHTCPICGHHDCFVVYDNGNEPPSFHCFSTNGGVGGTAIDYLMHTKNMNTQEATKYLIHDLCGIPDNELNCMLGTSNNKASAQEIDRINPLSIDDINDLELGRRFAEYFKKHVCYVKEWDCYCVFNGKYWERDKSDLLVKGFCKDFIDELFAHVLTVDDDRTRRELDKKLNRYLDEARRTRIVRDAKSECLVSADQFDAHPNLFNTMNGTFDAEVWEFREHRPEDMLTQFAPVSYDGNKHSEAWKKVISECQLGDQDTIRYIQKIFGKALFGDTLREEMYLFGFQIRSGKGTVLGTLESMLGTGESGYACNSQGNVLEKLNKGQSNSARGNVARMEGKRLIVCHEPDQGMIFDAALVKQLTGNDEVTVRSLYHNEKTFRSCGTIIIATNHMPVIDDRTLRTSGRIKVVPFENRLNESEQDRYLKDKLKEPSQLSGVLNWCLEGYRLYKEEGLTPSQRVDKATRDYLTKTDWVKRFIDECMIDDPSGRIKIKEAHGVFEAWGKSQSDFCTYTAEQFRDELLINGLAVKERARINGTDTRHVIIGKGLRKFN